MEDIKCPTCGGNIDYINYDKDLYLIGLAKCVCSDCGDEFTVDVDNVNIEA